MLGYAYLPGGAIIIAPLVGLGHNPTCRPRPTVWGRMHEAPIALTCRYRRYKIGLIVPLAIGRLLVLHACGAS